MSRSTMHSRRTVLMLSLLAPTALASAIAHAQSTDDAHALDGVVVIAERATTATKTDTPLMETPQAISVVTSQALHRSRLAQPAGDVALHRRRHRRCMGPGHTRRRQHDPRARAGPVPGRHAQALQLQSDGATGGLWPGARGSAARPVVDAVRRRRGRRHHQRHHQASEFPGCGRGRPAGRQLRPLPASRRRHRNAWRIGQPRRPPGRRGPRLGHADRRDRRRPRLRLSLADLARREQQPHRDGELPARQDRVEPAVPARGADAEGAARPQARSFHLPGRQGFRQARRARGQRDGAVRPCLQRRGDVAFEHALHRFEDRVPRDLPGHVQQSGGSARRRRPAGSPHLRREAREPHPHRRQLADVRLRHRRVPAPAAGRHRLHGLPRGVDDVLGHDHADRSLQPGFDRCRRAGLRADARHPQHAGGDLRAGPDPLRRSRLAGPGRAPRPCRHRTRRAWRTRRTTKRHTASA